MGRTRFVRQIPLSSGLPSSEPSEPVVYGSPSVPGTFQNGIAEGEVDPSFGPLEAMRLSVLTDSPVWVILSEVRRSASLEPYST